MPNKCHREAYRSFHPQSRRIPDLIMRKEAAGSPMLSLISSAFITAHSFLGPLAHPQVPWE